MGRYLDIANKVTSENENKASKANKGQASPPVGHRLRYPNRPTDNTEAQEIAHMVATQGIVLLWSETMGDLIAFYRDEDSQCLIPPGFVPYSSDELRELFGGDGKELSIEHIRLVHAAKKAAGGEVITQKGSLHD
ncbi:MAG: hypothetical protein HYX87_00085 [Chloroflexi bacterium]|nr:hypothetical protein [Chloroflexota bacterium]